MNPFPAPEGGMPSGGRPSPFHLHVSSLIGSLVITSAFFFMSKSLIWTPYLVIGLAFVAIAFIYKQNLDTVEQQVSVWVFYSAAIMLSLYVETHPLGALKSVDPPTTPTPATSTSTAATPAAGVAAEDLEGSFTGFRERSFIVLTIDKVTREPSRVLFRYSLNEGLRRAKGQGIIYTLSSTLKLADDTRFRYQRDESGKITLWSLNRNYELSKTAEPH